MSGLYPRTRWLIEDALRFALDVGIVVYDAIFCVAAERSRSALITEDTRLINSLAGTEVRTVALQTWVPPA